MRASRLRVACNGTVWALSRGSADCTGRAVGPGVGGTDADQGAHWHCKSSHACV